MINKTLLACAFLLQTCLGDTIKITQVSSGKSLEVTPISFGSGKLSFKQGGKTFTVPISSLTPDSRKAISKWHASSHEIKSGQQVAINKAIGHQLFLPGQSLWDETSTDTAKRLDWAQESFTGSISFRSYPSPQYSFLNAHPYCCTLYANDDKTVKNISMVFANKGDFGSTVGFGKDHFKPQGDLPTPSNLNEAIENDTKAISTQLTTILGEPAKQYYGEKSDRRKVLRWDFNNHAFILSTRENEYTHLLVTPSEIADKEGKQKFIKDQDLRRILAENLVKKDNGDTYIGNIPMVDQGPKGYCAPATFERAMRYMQVPADMYLLATIATKQGGGTNTNLLASEAKQIIRSKARRIKDLDLESDLSMRLVKRTIDKGIPILWHMRSLDKYNAIADARTAERTSIKDLNAWKLSIQQEADKVAPSLTEQNNNHASMIIGYNEATNEIAVSDSWGPEFALRWVHLDIAKAVTLSGGFVIDL